MIGDISGEMFVVFGEILEEMGFFGVLVVTVGSGLFGTIVTNENIGNF